ncbi:MAG TPA: hypothetical protein VFQ73_11915 [Flavisolibacter sp.]|nr:hypothetical protein [Flavisolibacter sp.]
MKAVLKRLNSLNTTSLLRNFFISILFMAFFVATLYFLITSPA